MAYSLKYWCEYTCYDQTSTRIEFEFDGFVGTPKIITLGENPLRLGYGESGQNPLSAIKGRWVEIDISVEYTDQYTDLFDFEYRDIRVKVYKGLEIEFVGFLIPDIYYQEAAKTASTVSVTAIDGIRDLSSIQWYDIGGITYEPFELKNIKWFFDKILKDVSNFSFNSDVLEVFSSINIVPNGSSSALDLSKYNLFPNVFYINDRKPISYDILSELLESFNCSIFQHKGRYYIVDLLRLGEPTILFDRIISGGTVSGSRSVSPEHKNISTLQGTIYGQKAAKQVNVTFDQQSKTVDDFAKDSFEEWTNTTTLRFWTKVPNAAAGGAQFEQDSDAQSGLFSAKNENTGILSPGDRPEDSGYITREFLRTKIAGTSRGSSFSFYVKLDAQGGTDFALVRASFQLRMNNYYLNSAATAWTMTAGFVEYFLGTDLAESASEDWTKVEFELPRFPVDLGDRLEVEVSFTSAFIFDDPNTLNSISVDNFEFEIVADNINQRLFDFTATNPGGFTIESFRVQFGSAVDIPYVPNPQHRVFLGVFADSETELTANDVVLCYENNTGTGKRLQQWKADKLAAFFLGAKRQYKGEISERVNPFTVVTDPFYQRKMIIGYYLVNDKMATSTIEAFEL